MEKQLYVDEMMLLLARAHLAWATLDARPPIFSVNLWTDPEAGSSAVNIDTRANSDYEMKLMARFAEREGKKMLKRGNVEMAGLLRRPFPRNTNPAAFQYRRLAQVQHKSFDVVWGSCSDCWDILLPLLLDLRHEVVRTFSDMELDSMAEVSVNSSHEWYDHAIRFIETPA